MLMYEYWTNNKISRLETEDSEKPVKEHSKVEQSDDLLSRLYNYLSKFKVLTRKEEAELFTKYQKNADLKARKRIELHNLKLVVSIAKKFTSSGIPEEDLINFGYIGLRRALDKFDLSRGNKFSTCLTWWVRQSIARAISDTARSVRVPAYLGDECKKYKKTINSLEGKLGREPSELEICWSMGIDREKLNTIKNCLNSVISLDHSANSLDEESDPLIASIEDESSNFASLNDINHDIANAVESLPSLERKIITLKYLHADDLTNEKIGEMLGISKVKVANCLQKGLELLRNSGLKNY